MAGATKNKRKIFIGLLNIQFAEDDIFSTDMARGQLPRGVILMPVQAKLI